jgi:hypothetical protein
VYMIEACHAMRGCMINEDLWDIYLSRDIRTFLLHVFK